MVRSRLAAFTAVLACLLAVLFVAAGTASARHPGGGGGISGNPPGGGGSQPPGGGSSSGSSGDPKHGTQDGCSLYANSSSFGLSCVTGGSGDAKTVREILDGDTPPICWDAPISDQDLADQYGYQPNPDAPYYLYSCISNLQLDQSLYNQQGLQLDQHVIEIGQNSPQCDRSPKGEIKLKPDQTEYDCVMSLTQNQQTVVNGLTDFHGGDIPGLVITTHPSTKVRTNEAVAYTDPAENGETETPHVQVGGVTMWATMNRFTIYPYGPDGGVSKVCNGAANVSDQDTPQTKPDACWWTYPQSSADQPGQVYPFRAEADWTVYVDGTEFAHFQKYDDLQLPVFDIQSLIVH